MSGEKLEASANSRNPNAAQSETEGFTPLQLEAVGGQLHYPDPKTIPSQFTQKPDAQASSKLTGFSSTQLGMGSIDGGWMTFDNAKNIVAWESKDGKTKRTFTYHDATSQRKELFGITNQEVYQDKNGTFFQYENLNGQQIPKAKLFTRDYDTDTYADVRGVAHKEAIFHRAVNADGSPTIAPVSLTHNLELSAALDMVSDNKGHIWKRLHPGELLTEFVINKNGTEIKTGRSFTDAQLLPHDIFDEPEKQKLYHDEKHPLESIKSVSIQQKSLPNCYFESALIDEVKAHSERIPQIIKDNHDGTYTVKFPLSDPTFKSDVDFEKRPTVNVTVDAPTHEELFSFNAPFEKGQKNGYWASVIEKAHRYLTGKISEEDGGTSADAMQLLTGVRAVTSVMKSKETDDTFQKQSYGFDPRDTQPVETNADWLGEIKSALQRGKLVSANTPHNGDQWLKVTGGTQDKTVLGQSTDVKSGSNKFHLLDDHVFSVLKVEHDDREDADVITMRNPVGSVLAAQSSADVLPFDKNNDGYFKIRSQDFARLFVGFYVNDASKRDK